MTRMQQLEMGLTRVNAHIDAEELKAQGPNGMSLERLTNLRVRRADIVSEMMGLAAIQVRAGQQFAETCHQMVPNNEGKPTECLHCGLRETTAQELGDWRCPERENE